MAAPIFITTYRKNPQSQSNELWAVGQIDDPVEDISAAQIQPYINHGLPLYMRKIAATLATGSLPRDLPYDGATPDIVASGTDTAQLATDVPDLGTEYVGMLLAIINGTGAGQVRRITAYNHSSPDRQVTLSRTWSTNPAASDDYRLLIPCLGFNNLHIKTEFSSAGSTTNVDIRPLLFVVDPIGLMIPDRIENIDHLNFGTDISQSTYKHGRTHTVLTRGALGAKIRALNLSTDNISVWAGAA